MQYVSLSVASLSLSSPRNISLVCLSILFFTLDYVMFCFNYLMCHVKRSTLSVPWWPAVNTNSSLQTLGGANPSLLKWFLVFMMQILIKGRFQEVVYTVFSCLAQFTLLSSFMKCSTGDMERTVRSYAPSLLLKHKNQLVHDHVCVLNECSCMWAWISVCLQWHGTSRRPDWPAGVERFISATARHGGVF